MPEENWKDFSEGISFKVLQKPQSVSLIPDKHISQYDFKVTLEDGKTASRSVFFEASPVFINFELFDEEALASYYLSMLHALALQETRVYKVNGSLLAKDNLHSGKTKLITITHSKHVKFPAAKPALFNLKDSQHLVPNGGGYSYIKKGSGTRHPSLNDSIVMHYSVWNIDGEYIDSSELGGEKKTFALKNMVKGIQALMPLLVEGDRVSGWFPPSQAYGNRENQILNKTLIFELELFEIKPTN
ncbi:FKBP-type peptidyl-prolyl cis-trans isomerase [Paraglaciecola aestuariivivens]